MSGSAFAEGRLTVFAAASLKGALDEVAGKSPLDVTISYGGSGLIARQIELGAPADLVILASTDWMSWLASRPGLNLLTQKDILGNRLVMIAPIDTEPLPDVTAPAILKRLDSGRIAAGLTQSVPAGIYAKQWLENAGLWSDLSTHLAQTDNVRAALALVAREEAPLGIVYASDAQADPSVQIVYEIPADQHDLIRYPVAVLDGKNAQEALEFAEFLTSNDARSIFAQHGFIMLETKK